MPRRSASVAISTVLLVSDLDHDDLFQAVWDMGDAFNGLTFEAVNLERIQDDRLVGTGFSLFKVTWRFSF